MSSLMRGLLLVLLLAAPTCAELHELKHGSYVHAVVFSPDGKRLASASNDGFIRIWDPAERKEVQAFKAEKNEYPRPSPTRPTASCSLREARMTRSICVRRTRASCCIGWKVRKR